MTSGGPESDVRAWTAEMCPLVRYCSQCSRGRPARAAAVPFSACGHSYLRGCLCWMTSGSRATTASENTRLLAQRSTLSYALKLGSFSEDSVFPKDVLISWISISYLGESLFIENPYLLIFKTYFIGLFGSICLFNCWGQRCEVGPGLNNLGSAMALIMNRPWKERGKHKAGRSGQSVTESTAPSSVPNTFCSVWGWKSHCSQKLKFSEPWYLPLL